MLPSSAVCRWPTAASARASTGRYEKEGRWPTLLERAREEIRLLVTNQFIILISLSLLSSLYKRSCNKTPECLHTRKICSRVLIVSMVIERCNLKRYTLAYTRESQVLGGETEEEEEEEEV